MVFPVYGLGNIPVNASWIEALYIHLYHLVLPIFCLTAASTPYVTAQLYQAMQEIQDSDFITTARAKGIREVRIVAKHILGNALLPLITLFSGFIPALVGGALVIEVIFTIPGIGSQLVNAVLSRNYTLLLGIVLVLAFVKIISHILADILYYLADPRIRF
jgi:peptide/nickel transport system permease protein